MSDLSDAHARRIAELEAELRRLKAGRDAPVDVPAAPPADHAADIQGAATVSGTLRGNAIGVNYGTVQAFFGSAQSPDDGKELLDSYLEALVASYGRVRFGKLLADEQTGREEATAPSLPLRAVYTALATNGRLRAEGFRQSSQQLLAALDASNPDTVLPEQVRLAVLRAPATPDRARPARAADRLLAGVPLAEEWAGLRRQVAATDARLTGHWYRPELAVAAAATQPRLVLLGGPGSGKSTVLRYLVVALAETLLAGRPAADVPGWQDMTSLPIPLFCQLGRVAQRLGDDPDADLDTLIAALLAPIEQGRMRAGLAPAILRAWRGGGALLCLDGLDEVGATPEPTQHGLRSRRERLAAAIRSLADQVGRARIVVTCRTRPYEQRAAWQLRDEWAERRLEPFTLGQMRHFVPAWYDQAGASPQSKYQPDEAHARADQLVAVLASRPGLRELTASPLLLTMLVLLHYNRKQLPDERADVYEELVSLLLERWEGVRSNDVDQRVASIGQRLGLPQLTPTDLRPILHEIAFAAHQQVIDGRGVLTAALLRARLDAFFAHKLSPTDPRAAARGRCADATEAFIAVLREETGLLQEEDDEIYVLPHLTFEEYLAACHLAGREDVDLAYSQWCESGERWHEVLLLLIGRLRHQEKFTLAFAWLEILAAQHCGTQLKPAAQHQRDTLLAVACYTVLGRRAAFAGRVHDVVRFEEQLRSALVALLERPDPAILLPQRVEAGTALGELGDPRTPITPDEWCAELARRNEQFGVPNGYWCYVQPGTYQIGGWQEDEPSAALSLPGYWIARFPVTVAQYALFVDVGYGPDAERWWTPQGWAWKQQKLVTLLPQHWNKQPYDGRNQPVIGVTWYEAVAFCAWLSERLVDALPAGHALRLPTEAEWEAATYNRDRRRSYPWGNEPLTPERAIYYASGRMGPAPVGCCPAGAAACGALDLVGNVWEWAASNYWAYPQRSSQEIKEFTQDYSEIPLRGGAYYNYSTSIQHGARSEYVPGGGISNSFRVVLVPRLAP